MRKSISGLRCAKCGAVWKEAALQPGETGIITGMAMVCIDCGHLQIVGKDGQLRHFTRREHEQLMADPKGREALRRAQETFRQLRASDTN